jgi:hypothetical protein
MKLPDLKHDYYDAHIADVKIGPRREVTLTMQIHVPNRNYWLGYETIILRFGGIVNFEAVKKFFDGLVQRLTPIETIDRLHYLRYATDQSSKPGSLFVEMEFDRSGEQIRIHCSNISVSTGKP